jgi:hypothetical protein
MKDKIDCKYYLNTFQKAADQLDKEVLQKKQIEVAVGEVLNSFFLKLYKNSWTNPSKDPLTSESRIFFSIWINDSAIAENKIFYNIHALKLRYLTGYKIQSRRFADSFRDRFKKIDNKWENVSVKFGPLTLMEGWIKLDDEKVQGDVLNLANGFLDVENMIDETLAEFKI